MPVKRAAKTTGIADLEAKAAQIREHLADLACRQVTAAEATARASTAYRKLLGQRELGLERVSAAALTAAKAEVEQAEDVETGLAAAREELESLLAAAEGELARARRERLLGSFHGDVARAEKVVAGMIALERQSIEAGAELHAILRKILDHARSLGGDRSLEVPGFAAALWNAAEIIPGSSSPLRGALSLASTRSREQQAEIIRALMPASTPPAAVAGDQGE